MNYTKLKKKEKPVKVSAFTVTEFYAGKKALRDILIDLLYTEYMRKSA